MERNQ